MSLSASVEIPPKLMELIRKKGWTSLTEIQEKAFKPIYEGYNTLIWLQLATERLKPLSCPYSQG